MAIALSGSLILSGSITVSGSIISTGTISMSGSIASASYAANADLLDGLDSTVFTLTSSFAAQTASFTAFTASINSFSASILAQTASLNSFSSSVLTFTGSAATRLGALEAATGSLYSYTSSLNNQTASFATTGSNTFIGTQTITGSVLQSGSFTSTGTLTAQTLVIQTITSSVVYSSGSNIFGNAIGNTQTFTGSVLVTGSLTISTGGNVSAPTIFGSTIACSPIGCFATSCATSFIGGTMSGTTIYGSTAVCSPVGKFTTCLDLGGALTGTSATFSDRVFSSKVINSATISNSPADASFLLYAPTTTNYYGGIIGWAEGNIAASISSYDDGSGGALGLSFATGNNASISERLKISSTGASTFSSTIAGTTIYGSTAVCSPVGLFSGCVGIGTITPNTYLQIVGNISTTTGLQDAQFLTITNSNATANNYSAIMFKDSDGNNSAGLGVQQISHITNEADIVLSPRLANGDITERIRIKGNGNVGIGTASPSYALEICSNVADWASRIYNSNGAGNGLLVRTNNICTNTTAFGVYNGTQYTMAVLGSGAATFSSTITGTTIYGSTAVCSPVGKFTSCIDAGSGTFTGGVSIGTTNTTGKVSIQQTINDSGLYFFNCSSGTRFMFNHYCGSGINSLIIQEFDACNAFCRNIMTMASGGNVGIGTASPQAKLHVSCTANFGAILKVSDITTESTGILALGDGGTSTINVGVWRAAANSMSSYGNWLNLGGYDGILFSVCATGIGSQAERMRIRNDGGVLIGKCTTSVAGSGLQLLPNGETYFTIVNNINTLHVYDTTNSAYRFYVGGNGGISNYQANNINLSDERTKKDIITLESYWDKFKAIKIVKFKYKDQTHDDFNIGVIAQQVESIAPEFVDVDGFGETPEDGIPYKTIYTSDLHHATIAVLQEAMTKIETLEAKVTALENK